MDYESWKKKEAQRATPYTEDISESLFGHLVFNSKQDQLIIDDDEERMQIWIPKGICLISVNPFYDFFSQILIDIWFTLFVDR